MSTRKSTSLVVSIFLTFLISGCEISGSVVSGALDQSLNDVKGGIPARPRISVTPAPTVAPSPTLAPLPTILPTVGPTVTPTSTPSASPAAMPCATEPLRMTGTVFYYCACDAGADPGCVPGNDSNDGLSANAPKRTGWKDQFRTMSAGNTVALCRGGGFDTDISTVTNNLKCSASGWSGSGSAPSTCDLRDYIPPTHPEWVSDVTKLPQINGTVANLASNDTTQTRGLRFINLRANGPITNSSFYVNGSASDVEICNVEFRGGCAMYWNDPAPGQQRAQRWLFHHNHLSSMGSDMAILGGCTDCVIDSNKIENDTFRPGMRNHPVYLSVHNPAVAQRMKVTNNEIHACRYSATPYEGAVALVVHGRFEDLLIENNTITCDNPEAADYYQGGIEISAKYWDAVGSIENFEGFPRTIIRGNKVIGHSNGISIDAGPDSVIENNLVIAPSDQVNSQIGLGIYSYQAEDAANRNARIAVRNNTVYFPGAPGTGIEIGNVGGSTTGFKEGGLGNSVANNVVYYAGVPGTGLLLSGIASQYELISNNATNGGHSTLGSGWISLAASPFKNVPLDFTPAFGLGLVDSGTALSACTVLGVSLQLCYAGTAFGGIIRSSGPPDIGALEFVP